MKFSTSSDSRVGMRVPPLSGRIARDVALEILSGGVKPGQLLEGEIDACLRLRVSRTAYREAIRILMAKGLVESRQRAGTKVTASELWHWLDPDVVGWLLDVQRGPRMLAAIFELRRAIEPGGAALAAERRSQKQLQAMRQALVDIYRPAAMAAWMSISQQEFRSLLFESSGNPFFSAMGRSIDQALLKVAGERLLRPAGVRELTARYSELFAAISAADANAARQAMGRLIEHEWSRCRESRRAPETRQGGVSRTA